MAEDRSYDRGRAWRGGNEEEGGYGGSGIAHGDYGTRAPRYGRPVDEGSRGNIEYREPPVRRRERSDREGPHAGRGPRGYTRSDARISEDLNEAFTDHPYLDPSDVEVRVENGEVTLEGTVESRSAKRLAEEIADSVSGVRDVHNRLRVDANGPDPDPIDPPTL